MKNKPQGKTQQFQTKSHILKKSYVEKIVTFLNKKYSGFFKDKGYTVGQLTNDISKTIIEKDIKSFDLKSSLPKYEKMILEKISKMKSKKSALVKMENINKLLPKKQGEESNDVPAQPEAPAQEVVEEKNVKDLIHDFNKQKAQPPLQNQNLQQKENNIPFPTDKLERLKIKQKDQWAIRANQDHQKYLEEEKQKKLQKEEQMRKQKEYLEQQIREKQMLKEKQRKEDEDFYNQQKDNFPFTRENNLRKSQQVTNKIGQEPQRQGSQGRKKISNPAMDLKRKEEDEYNERIRLEQEKYEQEQREKKNAMREKYLQIQKENEENAKIKKMEREQQRQEKMKELYGDPFAVQQQDPRMKKYKTSANVNDAAKRKEELLNQYNGDKLEREIAEKEKREKTLEEEKKMKKAQMLNEYKMALDNQINEKKNKRKIQSESKLNEKREIEQIASEVDDERAQKRRIQQEKINSYKKLLDEQVQDKKNSEFQKLNNY